MMSWKDATRSSSDAHRECPDPGFHAIRFTLQLMIAEQSDDAPCVRIRVVYTFEQHVLERQLLPGTERIRRGRLRSGLSGATSS